MGFVLLILDNNMYSLSQETVTILKSKNITASQLDKLFSLLNKRIYPHKVTSHFDLDYKKNENSYFIYNDVKEILINTEACEIIEAKNLEALKNKLSHSKNIFDSIIFFTVGNKVDLQEIYEWQEEILLITDESAISLLGWEIDYSINKDSIEMTAMLSCMTRDFNENILAKNAS